MSKEDISNLMMLVGCIHDLSEIVKDEITSKQLKTIELKMSIIVGNFEPDITSQVKIEK